MSQNNENLIPVIVSNSYEKKYYLDKRLESLPKEVKDTLKILFVTLTEEVGGCITASFDNKEYDMVFTVDHNDDDFNFDEINAKYKLSKLERDNNELFSKISQFCKFKLNNLV